MPGGPPGDRAERGDGGRRSFSALDPSVSSSAEGQTLRSNIGCRRLEKKSFLFRPPSIPTSAGHSWRQLCRPAGGRSYPLVLAWPQRPRGSVWHAATASGRQRLHVSPSPLCASRRGKKKGLRAMKNSATGGESWQPSTQVGVQSFFFHFICTQVMASCRCLRHAMETAVIISPCDKASDCDRMSQRPPPE